MAPHSTMLLLLSLVVPFWPRGNIAPSGMAHHQVGESGHLDADNLDAAFAVARNTSGLTPGAGVSVQYPNGAVDAQWGGW